MDNLRSEERIETLASDLAKAFVDLLTNSDEEQNQRIASKIEEIEGKAHEDGPVLSTLNGVAQAKQASRAMARMPSDMSPSGNEMTM